MIWKVLHSWFLISRQFSYCVTQLLLHCFKMAFNKWLHILSWLCLCFSRHSSSLSPRPSIPDSLIITRKFYHLFRMRDSESVKCKVKTSCCIQGSYVGASHLQNLSCERPQISTVGVYTSNLSWQYGKNSSACSTMLILTAIGICQLHRI